MKGSPSPALVHVTPKAKVAAEKPVVVSPTPATVPETSVPAINDVPENKNNVEGISRIKCSTFL